jgi:hypothetical protein
MSAVRIDDAGRFSFGRHASQRRLTRRHNGHPLSETSQKWRSSLRSPDFGVAALAKSPAES